MIRLLPALSALALSACSLTPRELPPAEVPPEAAREGWEQLTLDDFVSVNGAQDTWAEFGDTIVCTGKPLGGARTLTEHTDFELVLEWRHRERSGNSGVFLWCPESAFTDLPPGELPRSGIEVQVLDIGYEEDWLESKGTRSDWFTSHGDIFPVGTSTMTATTPMIEYQADDGSRWTVGKPGGSRSFPTQRVTNPAGEWNHYRILAVGGSVTLWVNGELVNEAKDCSPATGYLALEAEGALVEYRNLWIRDLPAAED